jgi:hypothetical protein
VTFWEPLGMLGVLTMWGTLGFMPWCGALIATRGRLLLWTGALTFAAGMAGGVLVPALGGKDAFGFWISLLAATTAGATVSIAALRMRMLEDW